MSTTRSIAAAALTAGQTLITLTPSGRRQRLTIDAVERRGSEVVVTSGRLVVRLHAAGGAVVAA